MKKVYQAVCFLGEVKFQHQEVAYETEVAYIRPDGWLFPKDVLGDCFGPWEESELKAIEAMWLKNEEAVDILTRRLAYVESNRLILAAAMRRELADKPEDAA